MLTQMQVLAANRESKCIDNRDFVRLIDFFPVETWRGFGYALVKGCEPPTPRPWTEEEIIKQMLEDVSFGIEKAENQRGISANLMFEVVKMWLWILEDGMTAVDHGYGLYFFEKVQKKYANSKNN